MTKVQRLKHVSALKQKQQQHIRQQVTHRIQLAGVYLQRAIKLKKKELILLAAEMYLDILTFQPNCSNAYIGLSKIEFHFGDIERSLMLLNQAKKLSPGNKSLHILIQKVRREIDRAQDGLQQPAPSKVKPQKKLPKKELIKAESQLPKQTYHSSSTVKTINEVSKKSPLLKQKPLKKIQPLSVAKRKITPSPKVNSVQKLEPAVQGEKPKTEGFSLLNI